MNIAQHITLLFFIPSFIFAATCDDTTILNSLKQAVRYNDITSFSDTMERTKEKHPKFFTPVADYVVEKKKTSPHEPRLNAFIAILDKRGVAPSLPKKRTKFLKSSSIHSQIDMRLLSNIREGNENDVKKLLKAKADVNARYRTKHSSYLDITTPLIAATLEPEIRQMILDAKADPNASDHNKTTPAMHAASSGDKEALRQLMAAGALLELTDRKGSTVVDYASNAKKNRLATTLKKALQKKPQNNPYKPHFSSRRDKKPSKY